MAALIDVLVRLRLVAEQHGRALHFDDAQAVRLAAASTLVVDQAAMSASQPAAIALGYLSIPRGRSDTQWKSGDL